MNSKVMYGQLSATHDDKVSEPAIAKFITVNNLPDFHSVYKRIDKCTILVGYKSFNLNSYIIY